MKQDPPSYHVKVTNPLGVAAILSHNGRLNWTKRTAQKHARDYLKRWPGTMAEVLPW